MGAQIMARAGYDPREMANMFKTIQAEGGRSGPEWLSSHPDPGNRYDAIVQEASMLRVEGNANSGQFQSIKSRLAGMSPAYTAEQIAKGQAKTGGRTVGTSGRRVVTVEPPSNSYRTHQPSDFLRVSVPANWEAVDASAGGVTLRPRRRLRPGGQRRLGVHARRAGGRGAGRRRQPAAGHAAVAPELLAVESGSARRGEVQTREHPSDTFGDRCRSPIDSAIP